MIADGLATLSDEQLAGLKEVYIVPYANPGDHGVVANHKGGVIQYFPRSAPHPQADIDWVMQHESAHGVWDAQKAADPEFVASWQRAADQDHRPVSGYGGKNLGEDFAEFMILYSNVLGSQCEGSARALFPNRMKAMDGLFPKGLPTRNPKGADSAY